MAAWALRRQKGVRILDVGHAPDLFLPAAPWRLLQAEQDLTPYRIGAGFEGLRHLREGQRPVSLKLRAPALDFVTRDADRLGPVVSATFHSVLSLAKGGFGNAWGAGVYRFQEDELRGMPLATADLAPHYDEVSRHIGISGAGDDLGAEFGVEPHLQPPLRLGPNSAEILAAYQRRRGATALEGLRLGHARLAVLSQPHRSRQPYAYRGTEFFEPAHSAAYNPASTIDELSAAGLVDYQPGWLVRRYRETEEGVAVDAERLTGGTATFHARRLILAAGTLNSSRIVLESAGDYTTPLPLLDNPITVLTVLHPGRIGKPSGKEESGYAQLNLVLDAATFGKKYQGSVYGAGPVPVAEFVSRLPFPIPVSRRLLESLLPALSVVMVFHPASPAPAQYLRLREDGALAAEYGWSPDPRLAPRVAAVFRALGCWAHGALSQHAGPGQGIHYAGSLPLSARPGRYQLHPDGRLEGTRHVYVCDGSCFPHLPAKNLTFTIMANAHRIANGVAAGLP